MAQAVLVFGPPGPARNRADAPALPAAPPMPTPAVAALLGLAAALALPAEFPHRDLILFLAFCAILATLVLQGTTLGPLIRRLGVSEPEDEPANPAVTPEAIEARSTATVAAMEAVKEKLGDPEHADAAEDLLRDLRVRAKHAEQPPARLYPEHRHRQRF